MNKANLILALTLATLTIYSLYPSSAPTTTPFEEWLTQFSHLVQIKPEEMIYRAKIFENNVKEINAHNSIEGKTYKLGINQFTAYTQEEFELMFLSPIETPKTVQNEEQSTPNLKLNVNWVTYGAVSPVKNQGNCIASYAFSAIGGIEGVSVINFKTQQEYSVQQVVDCSSSYGNNGCTNGNMANSFNYIAAKGINTELSYPYKGVSGTCQTQTGLFKIKSYSSVTTCATVESALTGRPISVAVDGQNFKSYTSGIFDNCGTTLSLAGLLVGGTDLYYTFKNSWGTSWGEAGYIRILRSGNPCGICSAGSYPVV